VPALGGILQLESYLQVDPVVLDVPVLYADVHILDPRALYAPERLGGTGDGLVDGVLEASLECGAQLGDRRPERLARLAADAFYSPELRIECAQVHMDIPIFSNISSLQYFLPVLLKYRFLVRMCIPQPIDSRRSVLLR
jgi:hypothetical protein